MSSDITRILGGGGAVLCRGPTLESGLQVSLVPAGETVHCSGHTRLGCCLRSGAGSLGPAVSLFLVHLQTQLGQQSDRSCQRVPDLPLTHPVTPNCFNAVSLILPICKMKVFLNIPALSIAVNMKSNSV